MIGFERLEKNWPSRIVGWVSKTAGNQGSREGRARVAGVRDREKLGQNCSESHICRQESRIHAGVNNKSRHDPGRQKYSTGPCLKP
jgi:hypothetical protein